MGWNSAVELKKSAVYALFWIIISFYICFADYEFKMNVQYNDKFFTSGVYVFLGENSSLCLFCRRSVSIYFAIYKKMGSSKSMNSVNQVRQIRQKSCHYYFSHLTSLRILYKITPTILHQNDQLLTKYLWLEIMLSTYLRYRQSILLWFHSS